MPSYKPSNASSYAAGKHSAPSVSRRKVLAAATVTAGTLAVTGFAATGYAAGITSSIDSLKARALAMVDEAKELANALTAFDFVLAQEKAHAVNDLAVELQEEFSGGLWTAASFIPVYGSDVKAVRSLVGIVASLTGDALVPLCDAMAGVSFDTLVVTSGDSVTFDMVALQNLIGVVSAVMPTLRTNVDEFNKIGDLHIEQLDTAVTQVRDILGPYLDKLDFVDAFLDAAPRLLGAQGSRTYMVVAQNNTEIRSTGGFPGSVGFVTAQNGTLTLGGFASMYDYMPRDPGIYLELSDDELALFGDGISYYAGVMNSVPHFPRACDLWSQILECSSGIAVDGVVAVDPVFLQNLVGLFGSITMSDGTVLDDTNTASAIMNDAYWRYNTNNAAQDAFFTEAAGKAIDLIMGGISNVDPMALLKVVKKATDTRRLTVWLRDSNEQAVLRLAGCTGELGDDPAEPVTGIYLSDETWGKMGWWIDASTTTSWQPAQGAGGLFGLSEEEQKAQVGGTVTVTHAFTNTLPLDYLDYSNPYVFGYSPARRQDGDIVFRVFLYAPAGGSIQNLSVGAVSLKDHVAEFGEAQHMGLQVFAGTVKVLPGEDVTLTYDVVCSPQATTRLTFDKTPLCHD